MSDDNKIYPCKYCRGIGQHYRMGKLETCFACKGEGLDVECYEANKHRKDYYIINQPK